MTGRVEELRAVSDNGKRWRIVPVDGDWEMVPYGHITAGQAERLCKAIEHAQSMLPEMVEALKAARQFIANGVELGFIRIPDADTPDPAHDTLPVIEAALARVGASS